MGKTGQREERRGAVAMSLVTAEQDDAGVRVLKLNRPEKRNALNTALLHALAADLERSAVDSTVRCVILAGDERAFSAGADIHEMEAGGPGVFLNAAREAAWKAIEQFPKPLVAAVEGVALGSGNELVLLADFVVAGDAALFGQPETAIGGMPGDGGTQRLIRVIGKGAAMQMILSGKPINAADAYRLRLVTRLCAAGTALGNAREIAHDIAAAAPLAVQKAKKSLLAAFELPLSAGLAAERRAMLELIKTFDRNEGLAALAEKRKPRFEGR
jgi:enoyl-CoA hydratase